MKKAFYLTAPILILALFVLGLGCGQGAPTFTSANELVPQIDAPTVSSNDESVPQLTHGVEGNPTGNCCPEGFDFEAGIGDPADRNEDGAVCRRVTAGGTITIDNNATGDCCSPFIPPGCV